jgi:type III secretion protein J
MLGRCQRLGRWMLLASALALAGCKTELYSRLPEMEANQMMAVLLSNGIQAYKEVVGEEGVTISVDDENTLKAIAILNDNGYPKSSRDSIGKVFQKSGIMSSPFEERIRFIYALGEEVAQTLSQIDGVVTARVHIVLPDEPQLGRPVKPSSAAVFIKHQPGVDLDFFVPQIRRLVSNAIEGLDYSAVTVVLVEAQPTKTVVAQGQNELVEIMPGLSLRRADAPRFWQLLIIVAAIAVVLIAGIGALAFALWRARRRPRSSDRTALAQVEPT